MYFVLLYLSLISYIPTWSVCCILLFRITPCFVVMAFCVICWLTLFVKIKKCSSALEPDLLAGLHYQLVLAVCKSISICTVYVQGNLQLPFWQYMCFKHMYCTCIVQHKQMSQLSQAVKKEVNRQLHIRYLFILCVSDFFKYIYQLIFCNIRILNQQISISVFALKVLHWLKFCYTELKCGLAQQPPSLLSKLCDLEMNEVKYFANGLQK